MVNLTKIAGKVLPFLKKIGPSLLRGIKKFGSKAIKGLRTLGIKGKGFLSGGGISRALKRGSEISKQAGEIAKKVSKVATPIVGGIAIAKEAGLIPADSKASKVAGAVEKVQGGADSAQKRLFGLSKFLQDQAE